MSACFNHLGIFVGPYHIIERFFPLSFLISTGRWCRREWSSPADNRNADATRRLYSSVFLGSPGKCFVFFPRTACCIETLAMFYTYDDPHQLAECEMCRDACRCEHISNTHLCCASVAAAAFLCVWFCAGVTFKLDDSRRSVSCHIHGTAIGRSGSISQYVYTCMLVTFVRRPTTTAIGMCWMRPEKKTVHYNRVARRKSPAHRSCVCLCACARIQIEILIIYAIIASNKGDNLVCGFAVGFCVFAQTNTNTERVSLYYSAPFVTVGVQRDDDATPTWPTWRW